MKRLSVIFCLIFVLFISGCEHVEVVEEYPIDARYTESYVGIETTYHMEWVYLSSGSGWTTVPDTHSVVYPEKYEIQYRINYSNGSTTTEWRQVARDEYMAFTELSGY